MAGKQYQVAFQLGAKVQSSMGKAFGTTNKGLQSMQNQAGVTTRALSGISGAMKAVAGAAAAYMGIRAMKEFASESVELAKAQIEVETKLEAVLKNVKSLQKEGPEAYKKAKIELLGMASELQNVGVIGDEVTIAGMQQLATFQMSQKEIGVLSGGMLDLLAQQKGLNASQSDAVGIANMIGKVMEGQVGALSRVGISFTEQQEHLLKTGDRMQRAAILAEILEQNVGGVNAALADTDQGKIQQMNNAWGDMKEEIGKKILPIQAKFARWFFVRIPKIQGFILSAMDKLSSGINFVGTIFDKLNPNIDNVISRIQGLSPNIDNVRGKFEWFGNLGIKTFNNVRNAIQENAPTLERARDLIGQIGTKVEEALVVAFETARPVVEWMFTSGLPKTIDILSGVVDGAMDLYGFITDNWPKMEPVVFGIVGALGAYKLITFTSALMTKGLTLATTAWTVVAGIGTAVTTTFGVAVAFLTSPIGIAVIAIGLLIAVGWAVVKNWEEISAWFGGHWNNFMAMVAPVGDYFVGVFTYAYDGITSLFSGIGSFFQGVFDGAINIAKGSVNVLIGIVNSVIGAIGGINIDIPKWVPKFGGETIGFNIPKIPMLATGGVAVGPTLAMIGEGKEKEAILPLSKLQNLLNSSNSSTSKNTSDNQPIVVHATYEITIQGNADKEIILKATKEANDDLERKLDRIIDRRNRLSFSPS